MPAETSTTTADRLAPADPVLRQGPRSADLGEFAAILAGKALFIGVTVALFAALAIAYLAVTSPVYTASTSILIDARARAPLGSEDRATPTAPDTNLVESQLKIIGSDAVMRRVVLSEKLVDDPEFAPTKPGLRRRLFAMLGIGSADFTQDERELRAMAELQRKLSIRRSERTYIIEIEATSVDAQKAARIANAVSKAYVADLEYAGAERAKRDSDWLKGRLEDLQARVQDAENRVEAFRRANGLVGASGKLIVEQQLGDVNGELAAQRVRVAELKVKYDQMQRILAAGRAPEAVADVVKSGVIERLRTQYAEIVRLEANYRATLGPRHPALLEAQQQLRDTRRLIVEESRRLAEAAGNEYRAARDQEAALARQVDGLKSQASTNSQAQVQLRELEREAEASRDVYQKFLRARETVKENAIELPIARVLAPAVTPLAPSGPRSFAILSLALASGLGFGVGGALVSDYVATMRRRPKAPAYSPVAPVAKSDDAAKPAATPSRVRAASRDLLSLLARVRRPAPSSPPPAAPKDVWRDALSDPQKQALGDLARRVFPASDEDSRSLLLVPLCEGDAHRLVGLRLARQLAAEGRRVLLIEADAASPALRAAVAGAAPPDFVRLAQEWRAAHRVAADGDGSAHVALNEPLDRDELRAALRDPARRLDGLRRSFDIVIFAGPSAESADVDALAEIADRVLLVADGAAPERASVDAALDLLDLTPRQFAGVASTAEPTPPVLDKAA